MGMAKGPEEWFQQAQYDLRTAEAMFEAKKFIYEEVLKWLKKELLQ
jgi:hypothetical protein